MAVHLRRYTFPMEAEHARIYFKFAQQATRINQFELELYFCFFRYSIGLQSVIQFFLFSAKLFYQLPVTE